MEVPIPGFRSLSAAAGEGLEWDAPSVTEQREKSDDKAKVAWVCHPAGHRRGQYRWGMGTELEGSYGGDEWS